MILSYKNKFIFIKSQKTAGTSLEVALSKFCSEKDIITPIMLSENEEFRRKLGFRGPQNFTLKIKIKEKVEQVSLFNHTPVLLLKKIISKKIFESFFKFTIVRNPFDQLLSYYFWGIKRYLIKDDFKLFCEQYAKNFFSNEKKIISINNTLPYDKIIKYENLRDDLSEVSQKLKLNENIYDTFKEINLKSEYRKEKKYDIICNLSKNIILEEASFFFEKFGYNKYVPKN